MRIKIADIIVDEKAYPRFALDNETVNRYREALEFLPAIQVNPNLVLIDGYHRLTAWRMSGAEDIEAEIIEISDDNVLEEAIARNARHGKQLTMPEKRHWTPILFERMTGKNGDRIDKISALLGVQKRTVYDWTADQRSAEKAKDDKRILDLWLRCWTEEQIAQEVEKDQSTIHGRILKIASMQKFIEIEPTDLQYYDRWSINTCDPRFGMDYPGRIPGQIIENVLWYWTDPGDVVIDPFGGSGTTIDVCRRMGRRYVVSDLRPTRPEIIVNDATRGMPKVHLPVKLIFLDPPYWTMKDSEYPDGSVSAATSYGGFLDMMQSVAAHAWQTLMPGGVCAFYMMPLVKADGEFYDIPRDCANRFELVGFTTERTIHGWIGNQHITGAEMSRAKAERRLPNKTVLIELRIFRKKATP